MSHYKFNGLQHVLAPFSFEEKQNGAYMLQMIARKRSKMLNIKVVILAQIITKITDQLENNKFVWRQAYGYMQIFAESRQKEIKDQTEENIGENSAQNVKMILLMHTLHDKFRA